MRNSIRFHLFVVLGITIGITVPSRAGEREILSAIKQFFDTDDLDQRQDIARNIEADESYVRSRVSEWLHQASLIDPLTPGEMKVKIPLDHGGLRTVAIRVPKNYTADRAWPLIIMFHGGGASGPWSLRMIERILGDHIDEYIVAGPGNFEQDVIDSVFEPSVEHPAVILALKKMLNVDSDRVFVFGISAGGYCCWTLATLHPDLFAGAFPMSCTYSFPSYIDGLWEAMLPNVRHLPVLHVWGEQDENRTIQVHGVPADPTVAILNRRFMSTVRDMGLENIQFYEIPDRGHFPAFPTSDQLQEMLSAIRVKTPDLITHRFRYIYQSPAYWLEGHTWIGDQWLMDSLLFITLQNADPKKRVETGEWILECLGELRGTHDSQLFEIQRKHVGEMTLWVMDGMVDWTVPIRVRIDDRDEIEITLTPDLFVCLSQAARTYDFEQLRWSGLRIQADGSAIPVTGETYFPPLMKVESYSKMERIGN